jgi:peptidyl-prolyl cis-trans isomerase D
MLRGIRNASTTWLGRIVMGAVMTLLAGIFALWGINDIFRGFGQSALAKIGSTEIQSDQFRKAYNDRLQTIGQQLHRPITPEQANAFGLDRQVLSEMVAQAGLDQRAHQMGLAISDAEITRLIVNNQQFQGPDGKFDRARFQDALINASFTEQRFVAEQRGLTLRRQIIDSVSGKIPVPQTWLTAINQFQNEQRSISYLALGPAQAGDIPQPTDDQLAKYFDERKIMFRAPEYRRVVSVAALPADLAKTVEVSDDEVKKVFDERRNQYITPEKRHVEQMVFPTMADAQAASDRIKGGSTSFAALATERGMKEQDLDLGMVSKSMIIDPAVADAAFALKQGEVSGPVQGRFGAVIVTVSQIVPEEDKTFADVAPQIRNDIAMVRVKNVVQDIHEKIEDDRAGGATLGEAAAKLKLPVVTLDAVDRSGHDPNGNLASNGTDAARLVSAAFATDVGVDNDPLEADGGYIWYDVAGITPARDRNLDEVRSQVVEHWRDDEIASRLKAKAADLLDKLKSGTAMDTLAAANGVKVAAASGIKRGQQPPAPISPRMLDTIFHTPKDGFAAAEGDKPTDWFVLRVTDDSTTPLQATSPAAGQITEKLSHDISDDVFGQYMAWIEDELGTTVNQAALTQALGNGAPDTN